MRIFFTILLAILLAIFAIQNSEIVVIKLFFWVFEIPEAILILVCILIGVLIGLIIPTKKAKTVKNDNDFKKDIEI
jgi:putative membrane protein